MRMYVCSNFGIMKNIWDKNKKSGSFKDHIFKYLAKRKTINQKIPPH